MLWLIPVPLRLTRAPETGVVDRQGSANRLPHPAFLPVPFAIRPSGIALRRARHRRANPDRCHPDRCHAKLSRTRAGSLRENAPAASRTVSRLRSRAAEGFIESTRLRLDRHAVNKLAQKRLASDKLVQRYIFVRLMRLLDIPRPAHDAWHARDLEQARFRPVSYLALLLI